MSAPPAAPALVALLGLGLLALIALAGADAVLDEGEHADDGHDAVGTDNDLRKARRPWRRRVIAPLTLVTL